MASSSLGFTEEKGSEHETSDVVSSEMLEGDLHQDQIDVGRETALNDETKRDAKRKSRDEGRAIRKRNAAAVSRMTASRTVTYVRRPRALRRTSIYIERVIPIIELEYVDGHPVRPAFAPMVRRIFAKHGDIASNVPFMRHPEITAVLLEVVCDVVKKIVQNDFHTVLVDLDDMMVLAPVAQMGEIDTSWLEKALEELYEIRNLIVKAAAKDFDAKKKMMMMAKKRFKKVQSSLLDQEV
ncbi:MATH domain and coiled-coil domain-containing protein At3g58210-like [Sesamum indicum]|uniref:MATH domain and coiled-coil domain-containing protein At3g58210-like n=1 Tax=Sesamum indicum TaxID=4182 RepID=A0A6I9SVA0_SESIN|nr:MATH domain and coiled-coil domain-containing protein At3g58210-like [Sesamum indicum]XP_011073336.1 MATH domain and coiled-coil domain-containing protein At3g58210-like [Sesamum indicum]XP_020548220.1 MATH domain and coiled-coil domain-containing protein At3g58210-like [Sesamum indicum]XP_020548221.1 MATH domain and coiled-coil domain-containing protein At3g58210-like [Sesamum indicum]XP_020548222.1 MATH domain and coiled-coil domain-containing protein At3g58210-like [Sesamum indicum]XP_02